jgi:hypothetical protein
MKNITARIISFAKFSRYMTSGEFYEGNIFLIALLFSFILWSAPSP